MRTRSLALASTKEKAWRRGSARNLDPLNMPAPHGESGGRAPLGNHTRADRELPANRLAAPMLLDDHPRRWIEPLFFPLGLVACRLYF